MERDVNDSGNCEKAFAGQQRHAGTGTHYTV
jgi:hypothetical protein